MQEDVDALSAEAAQVSRRSLLLSRLVSLRTAVSPTETGRAAVLQGVTQ